MRIQLRNNRAKFHPDPFWNVGVLGFFVKVPQQEQQEEQDEYGSDMRSLYDRKFVWPQTSSNFTDVVAISLWLVLWFDVTATSEAGYSEIAALFVRVSTPWPGTWYVVLPGMLSTLRGMHASVALNYDSNGVIITRL